MLHGLAGLTLCINWPSSLFLRFFPPVGFTFQKTKHEKSQGRSLLVGASSLGSKVSYMLCSVPASSRETWFAGIRSYSGVAQLFVCITSMHIRRLSRAPYLAHTQTLNV